MTARRQQVRQLVESAAGEGMPAGDPGRFISATWLQSWADAPASAPPPPIDNAPLLCTHVKLDPTRPGVMRRLPTHAWTELVTSCRGGPELGPSNTCPDCLQEALAAVAQKEDSNEARDRFLAMATALADENISQRDLRAAGVGAPAYYVSKPWLLAWQRREGRSMSTTPPTLAIQCPHGGLAPETLTKTSKRIAIPADFWAFLQRSWMFSEAERAKKARLKEAEKMRKAQGGAAVLASADGGTGAATGTGTAAGGKSKSGDDDVVEFVEMEIDAAQQAQHGSGDCIEIDDSGGGVSENTNNRIEGGSGDDDIEEIEAVADTGDEEERGMASARRSKKRGSDGNTTTATNDGGTSLSAAPLPEFSVELEECPVCCAEMEEAARLSRGLHSRVAAERSTLSHLVTPGLFQLSPGESYRLVPRAFMDHWRAYMAQAAAGRRGGGAGAAGALPAGLLTTPGDILEAPRLGDYMLRASCECHREAPDGPLLAFAPPQVVNRRGRWFIASSDVPAGSVAAAAAASDPTAFFELVNANDWGALMEHYLEDDLLFGVEGISATLKVEDKTAPTAAGNGSGERQQSPKGAAGTTAAGGTTGGVEDNGSTKQQQQQLVLAPNNGSGGTPSPSPAAGNRPRPSSSSGAQQGGDYTFRPEDILAAVAAAEAAGNKKEEAEGLIPNTAILSSPGDGEIIPDDQEIFGQDPDNLYDKKPMGNLRPGTTSRAWLEPMPKTCAATLAARETALKAARLSYMGAEVMVESSPTDEEAITATLVAAAAAAAGNAGGPLPGIDTTGERKSKRARKGRAPITVDCTSTLNDLRLRIYQALGVHPRNARVFVRGHVLDLPVDITLAECEIYPNEEIRVVDTGEHDPDDLTGLFGSPVGGRKGGAGGREGFGGTALTGLHLVHEGNDLGDVPVGGDVDMS